MSKRSTYHVTKTTSGWQSKQEGAERASAKGKTKREVMKETISFAKNKGCSSVVVHKMNGRIQEERTYGNDPYPPKG